MLWWYAWGFRKGFIESMHSLNIKLHNPKKKQNI